MNTKKVSIRVSDSIGTVSGEIMDGNVVGLVYVFAHGAGAGMQHPFMVRLSESLADKGIATLRYNFPYMEKGSRRPDVPAVAEKAVLAAISRALELYPGVPVMAGGKSFGGRMTSQALSRNPVKGVDGVVFTGFPLHAAGKPGTDRAAHLSGVTVPMLFLQGTRDALADIGLMEQVCESLPMAELQKFEGVDHSFRAGRQDLIPALADAISNWSAPLTQKG